MRHGLRSAYPQDLLASGELQMTTSMTRKYALKTCISTIVTSNSHVYVDCGGAPTAADSHDPPILIADRAKLRIYKL